MALSLAAYYPFTLHGATLAVWLLGVVVSLPLLVWAASQARRARGRGGDPAAA